MSRVLLTQPFDPSLVHGLQALLGRDSGFGMVSTPDQDEFARCAQDAEVLINIARPINAELLQVAPHVRFVQQMSVGYDQLDLDALKQRKIMAANAPGANAEAVAEQTLLLMLSLLKRFTQAEQSARANQWEAISLMRAGITDLGSATVGLIGFGAIGRAVAQRLRGFGSHILYTAPRRLDASQEEQLGVHYASLADLLASSTIVSLHLPLNDQTYHMIDAEHLAHMRSDALLINTSRGELIDEQALRTAIVQKRIAGAGLDVLEHEQPGGNIFTDLPPVIVTPHIGGLSQQALETLIHMVADNINRFLRGEQPEYLLFDIDKTA